MLSSYSGGRLRALPSYPREAVSVIRVCWPCSWERVPSIFLRLMIVDCRSFRRQQLFSNKFANISRARRCRACNCNLTIVQRLIGQFLLWHGWQSVRAHTPMSLLSCSSIAGRLPLCLYWTVLVNSLYGCRLSVLGVLHGSYWRNFRHPPGISSGSWNRHSTHGTDYAFLLWLSNSLWQPAFCGGDFSKGLSTNT